MSSCLPDIFVCTCLPNKCCKSERENMRKMARVWLSSDVDLDVRFVYIYSFILVFLFQVFCRHVPIYFLFTPVFSILIFYFLFFFTSIWWILEAFSMALEWKKKEHMKEKTWKKSSLVNQILFLFSFLQFFFIYVSLKSLTFRFHCRGPWQMHKRKRGLY